YKLLYYKLFYKYTLNLQKYMLQCTMGRARVVASSIHSCKEGAHHVQPIPEAVARSRQAVRRAGLQGAGRRAEGHLRNPEPASEGAGSAGQVEPGVRRRFAGSA